MIPEPFSFAEIAKKYADQPAIIGADYRISYRDYFQWIAEIAEGLRAWNISPGERVSILAPNCQEYPALLMALWQIGAIAAPLSPRFPETQIARLLSNIACKKIIVSRKLPSVSSTAQFEPLYLEGLVTPHQSPAEKAVDPQGGQHLIPEGAGAKPPKGQAPNPRRGRRQMVATLIFTSGSSGEPKAALHSFGNHIYNALGSNLNIPFGPGDRWLLSLPLYHVGGLAILFRALAGGGAVAVPETDIPLSKAINQLEVTHISLVATQLFRLLKEDKEGKSLANIKAILLGGSAIPPSLIDTAIERGLPIHTSYGSTEMGSQITTTPTNAPVEKLFTSGKVLKYREMKIAPDGEILVRGETRFRGYWEKHSLQQPFDAQGWFPTGDVGKLDNERYLTVLGRKDNMFISGGENIQPEEIEAQLCQMKSIEEAVVVSAADKEFGMRPAAFIKMQPGEPMNETAIRNFLKTRVARFKIPDHFFPWPETTPESGIKIDRKYFQTIAQKPAGGRIKD